MKRSLIILCAVLVIISFSAADNTYAAYYERTINADQMYLNHNRAYMWGLRLDTPLADNENLEAAKIELLGINNWRVEDNRFYLTLLDDPRPGINWYSDGSSTFSNYFGILRPLKYEAFHELGYYSDTDTVPQNFYYDFTSDNLADLTDFIGTSYNGRANFGIGFDPDCHFSYTTIKFKLWTEIPTGGGTGNEIPEPGTLILLGAGLGGLALFRRYNLKK